MENIYIKEKEYLEYVNDCIKAELKSSTKSLEELKKQRVTYDDAKRGDQFTKDAMMRMASSRIIRLNQVMQSPYFGRMDFTPNDTKELHKLYVGKTTLTGNDNQLAVIDWRSPISSMYYDSSVGKASYIAPAGIINGNISLKRQIIIEDALLKNILDTDMVTDDDILQKYLDVHADNKMKNIVASIQKEQNNIIRQPLNKNIIVQGVAGSGKTSVALHRIAYLIYLLNNSSRQTKVDSQQFMVIGPNNCFLDYISGVLPDLDVESVNQLTLSDLASELVDEKFKIIDQASELQEYYKNGSISDESSIKNSKEFEIALDLYIKNSIAYYENNDIECYGMKLFSKEDIARQVKSYSGNYRSCITNLEKNLIKKVKENSEKYSDLLTSKIRSEALSLPSDSEKRKLLFDKVNLINEEIKTGMPKHIKKHFEGITKKIFSHYVDFISNIDFYMNFEGLDTFKKTTSKRLSKKTISRDDIAPILYLKSQLDQVKEYDNTLHVVVDEAQDLGLLEFKVLRKIFPNATFSIYGDLNQAIFSYRSVDSWDSVKSEAFGNNCEIINMTQSYRTTDEIMTEANKISNLLTGTVSEDVIRHGEDVKYLQCDNNNMVAAIGEKLKNYIDKGYRSIAMICKTEDEARDLNIKLSNIGIDVVNINSDDNRYSGGICTISCGLAKGLEFDSTILVNVDSNNYKVENNIDMKLLYVAMTRALHETSVLTTGDLPNILNKSKVNQLIKTQK